MKHDPERHDRRSIRLPEYDYAQAGAYFITICTNNQECLFGEMTDGAVLLSKFGEIAVDEWVRTPNVRENVGLDAFVVMPNHLQGVVIITHENGKALPMGGSDPPGRPYRPSSARGPAPGSVGAIIGQFKAAVAERINVLRGTLGAAVWQRNYYEHVVRDEDELNQIRQYIAGNPAGWDTDENNPTGGPVVGVT